MKTDEVLVQTMDTEILEPGEDPSF